MKIDNCAVNKKDRYNAIDGLRTFAAIGVLAMHVNENSFCLSGFISERVIGVMGDFVFLFMIISGFSMYSFILATALAFSLLRKVILYQMAITNSMK